MRTRLLTAIAALAATSGLALGGEQPPTQPGVLPAAVPAVQGASPPQRNTTDSMPGAGVVVVNPRTGGYEPCAQEDWTCGPPSCFWLRAEYLLWWIRDSQAPALVTTAVPGAAPLPGVLGQPGTVVVFGGGNLDNQARSGGRFSGGFWLNDSQTLGLAASYFFLGSRSSRFDGVSGGALGSTVIARPFFDVLGNIQNAQIVAFPGIASGEIHIANSSRLQGADLNLVSIPCCTPCCQVCTSDPCESGPAVQAGGNCGRAWSGCNYWVSLLGGVRYLQLDENLGISETSRVSSALPAGRPLFGGSTIIMTDQFDTNNYFYGAQVGAQAELCWGRMFVDLLGKVALGTTHQVVDIRGATAITSQAGVTAPTPAGFLATGSNSGRFTRDVFAVVPELGVNVGCQITRNFRAFVGYSFLYWSSVVRPGDQVDVGLSGTRIPTDTRFNPAAGPARPAAILRDTDFWAQGVNLGLEFRF